MNHLSDLPLEILINITRFLSTKDVMNLSICHKHLHVILYIVQINDKVEFDKICESSYFDSFTEVVYNKSANIFPKSLHVLKWCCEDILPLSLPDSLASLEFGTFYNHPLPLLPDSLKSLDLGWFYNQPLPELPNSLRNLNLGYHYNHPLLQLPNSLKILYLSSNYNHILPQLSDLLENLYLGHFYNHCLPQLPDSLKILYLSSNYNHLLPQLPDSLRHLKIMRYK